MNKNLCLNDSEKEWVLKVRSILSKPQPPIPMPPNNEIWYRSSDGNIVNPDSSGNFGANIVSNVYENGIGIITFDGDVTGIEGYPFLNRSRLISITIPNSVTNIGQSAFSGCSGLSSIVVSDGNTVYDSRDNCNALIETSTNKLIVGCKNTIIPDSVTAIGQSAFDGCTGLTSVTIGNSVTSIGIGAFQGCTGLTSITIPNSVTSIEKNTFFDCRSFTSINIPDSVTSIGESAFGGCIGLSSIIIGNSVTSIGIGAFQGCNSITSITSLNTTPPKIQYFTLPSHTTYTIYVPSESVEAYKAKQYWSSKKSQIQPIQ